MNTTNKLVFSSIILASFLFLTLTSVTQVFADEELDNRVVILGIDIKSISSNQYHADQIDTVIGLMSTINKGDDFYFMPMDAPNNYIGPYRAGNNDFGEFTEQIRQTISNSESNTTLGIEVDQTLGESYGLLDMESAPPGSGIYLISTNNYPNQQEYISNRIDPVLDLFFGRQWHVSSFSLSGIPGSTAQVSKTLASSTGGNIFELNNISGLKLFTDHLLYKDNRGTLISSGEKKLTFSDLLISDIEVLPGTEYVMALFFRDNNAGSLRLKNPDGLEASTGDRSSSTVVETPNAVIWIINEPTPGIWNVDVTGISGQVSSWYLTSNKYNLNFQVPEVVPTDEAATISAFITEAQSLTLMTDGASMTAEVKTPLDTSVMYKLKDDGTDGDLASGDGYYSANIPAPLEEGKYGVSVQLSWPNINYNLTRDFIFEAQVFPSIEMIPLYTTNLFVGEEYTVATLYVKVKDAPYAVLPSLIAPQVTNDSQFDGILKINPRTPDADGKAWMYDVIFAPTEPGQISTIFNIQLDYADRSYSRATDNLVLESKLIPQAPAQRYSPQPPQAPTATPADSNNSSETNIPLGLIIPVSIVILLIAIVAIYRNSLPKPYGFISDESGNQALNFNKIPNTNLFKSIFARHIVTGPETGLEEFSGCNFTFGKGTLLVTATSASHTIRINNHPLVGSAYISDGTWIGATGKLFRFTLDRTYPDQIS